MPRTPASIRASATGWAAAGHDPDLDVALGDELCQLLHGPDPVPGDHLADHAGVLVEHGHDLEALQGEPLVGHQGPADVAGPDHGRVPRPIGPEDLAELAGELAHPVADAGMAELAEIGEVLSHLRVGEAQRRPQLLGADGLLLGVGPGLEFAQVQAQPLDGGAGDLASWRGGHAQGGRGAGRRAV
jgi:hypothetical protein